MYVFVFAIDTFSYRTAAFKISIIIIIRNIIKMSRHIFFVIMVEKLPNFGFFYPRFRVDFMT
jgi:hypothetical protein